jgi:hypothetical protein
VSPAFAATIVVGGSLLFAYSALERRLNQRRCSKCGFRGAADAFDGECPHCREIVVRGEGADRRRQENIRAAHRDPDAISAGQEAKPEFVPTATPPKYRVSNDLSKRAGGLSAAVLTLVPIFIAVTDAAIVLGRRVEPATEKAIRIVKESSSPIESFSIEQYLNGTLYYRGQRDSNVRIQGWTAHTIPEVVGKVSVEFGYSEGATTHLAHWTVNVPTRKVNADNADAAALSWSK